jgi:hypothetical protein
MANSRSEDLAIADVPLPPASALSDDPEGEYNHRLKEWERKLEKISSLHQRLWVYLITTGAGILIASIALTAHSISKLWLLPPSALLLPILDSMAKNARAHAAVERIVRFYELGVARLGEQWQGRGIRGDEFRPEKHAYASDLDLFGTGSIFEKLCTARTSVGRATLARWLLEPGECSDVRERHGAVAELRDKLDFREDWAAVGGKAVDQVDSSAASDWADIGGSGFSLHAQAAAVMLPILLIAVSILAYLGGFGRYWQWPVAVAVGLEILLAAALRNRIRLTAENVMLPSFELAVLGPLLARFETEQFQSSLLRSLQSKLTASSGRPSGQIRILGVLVWLLDLRRIEYFAILASPLLWGTNLAILIERWRQRNQEGLTKWLDSLGQFEALICLARHYYENPGDTFPILGTQSTPLFRAEALGHPSLDNKTCVRCDLTLDAQGTQLILVSGSNMSGKSTLLRSVGVNSVLALAGAPVRARRLVISPMQIGCSIAVQDSLLQAKSRFQAEVERLKWVLDLAKGRNMLFLLDEVLGGTNSNDRLLGASAVIEQLAQCGAVGLVTTHDLALTEVVRAFEGKAMNVHFEEHYENGEMHFDYKLRPGVLTRTNGRNVMAALGLLRGEDR